MGPVREKLYDIITSKKQKLRNFFFTKIQCEVMENLTINEFIRSLQGGGLGLALS
jgi:hypothetical protein